MKTGIVNKTVISRNRPGFPSWSMGNILIGTRVTIYDISGTWARVLDKPWKWIPINAIDIEGEIVSPPPVIPDGKVVQLKEHSQIPLSEANIGSFGIFKLYAHPAEHKPHNITLSDDWIQYIRDLNTADAFRWIFEHSNDTRYFGARDETTGRYFIPTQGVFMLNAIRSLGIVQNGLTLIRGLSGPPPKANEINYFTRPDLVHFMWCVGQGAQTITPPCGTAFFPVINPIGMKGSNVGGEIQTQIWLPTRYIL